MTTATANLVLHRGCKIATREEIATADRAIPQATSSWVPIPHVAVIDTVKGSLQDAGYFVEKESFGLSGDGAKFFGTLTLTRSLASGVALAVGIRSSFDKSLPMGFCAGSRVFVCDNLAFASDLMVKRKHTVNGARNFDRGIFHSVAKLTGFQHDETRRIEQMQNVKIDDRNAESLILRASVDKGIVPLANVKHVLREWREPAHVEFSDRSVWSLLNAFTEVMKEMQVKNPNELARRTMRLQAMLLQAS